MSEQLIQIETTIYTLDEALAMPQDFLNAIKPKISEKIFNGKEGEPIEKQVKRLFGYASHRKGFAVKTDIPLVSETPTCEPSQDATSVTVMQTPSALAMNSKDLAIDVMLRISDIVLCHVFVDEAHEYPSELMQALRNLNESAKAVKAAAECT